MSESHIKRHTELLFQRIEKLERRSRQSIVAALSIVAVLLLTVMTPVGAFPYESEIRELIVRIVGEWRSQDEAGKFVARANATGDEDTGNLFPYGLYFKDAQGNTLGQYKDDQIIFDDDEGRAKVASDSFYVRPGSHKGTDGGVTMFSRENDMWIPLNVTQPRESERGIKITRDGKGTTIYAHIAGGDYGFLSLDGGTHLRGGGNESSFGGVVKAKDFQKSSDQRLKQDVRAIDGALDKLLKLDPVKYRWKPTRLDKDQSEHFGLIAQDVEGVLPDLVSEDENGMKSIAYGDLVALLIEAVQSQQEQIEELQAQMNR